MAWPVSFFEIPLKVLKDDDARRDPHIVKCRSALLYSQLVFRRLLSFPLKRRVGLYRSNRLFRTYGIHIFNELRPIERRL